MSPSAQSASTGDGALDGRRARRERGRRAVIDAMIDLVLEGDGPPTADAVTERAGVSQASLFRYFSTLDELRQEAIGRYFERFDELITIGEIGEGPVPDRIQRLVSTRDAFYDRTAPVARLARRLAGDVPELAETLERVRSTFTDQIHQHFDTELERLEPTAREPRVAVIAALTSFESWDLLAVLDGHDRRLALVDGVTRLLDDS